MTTGEPRMTEMSKPAEILYRALVDELRWAKQQQWQITYYSVALIGAGLGLAKATSPTPGEKVMWSGLVDHSLRCSAARSRQPPSGLERALGR
jgi:hypothetical protein